MSHLWNNLRRRWFVTPACVGLAIGRERVAAAYVTRAGEACHLEWVREETLAVPLFVNALPDDARTALFQVTQRLLAPIAGKAIPIQIALPDPVVSLMLHELDVLPGTTQAQHDLVRWRFGKSLHLPVDAIDCSYQALGEEQGKVLLLGLATNRAWREVVEEAARQAGACLVALDMAACHRFNRFHDVLTVPQKDGLLIHVDGETWSVSLWDAEGRLRFVRSRWRRQDDPVDQELEEMAQEVEVVVRAYSKGGKGRTIAKVFVAGRADETSRLVALLRDRMHEEPNLLPSDLGIAGEIPKEFGHLYLAGTALAAAIPR